MVNVMCCHVVWGRVSKFVLIHTSVAFLPQDEQNLDLQEWGTFRVCPQRGHIKKWYPRKDVLQTKSFSTFEIIAGLIRLRCLRNSFHQFPLSNKMFFMEILPLMYSMMETW
jgi:hypothetical protein